MLSLHKNKSVGPYSVPNNILILPKIEYLIHLKIFLISLSYIETIIEKIDLQKHLYICFLIITIFSLQDCLVLDKTLPLPSIKIFNRKYIASP